MIVKFSDLMSSCIEHRRKMVYTITQRGRISEKSFFSLKMAIYKILKIRRAIFGNNLSEFLIKDLAKIT